MSILDCYCITFDVGTCSTEVGRCIYNCNNLNDTDLSDMVYHKVPSNVSMLNSLVCDKFRRTGTLCGECKNDTFPLAYSFNLSCVNCTDLTAGRVKYVLVAFVPLTVFYFLIVLFHINIMSSHIYGFIIFSQGISMPVLSRVFLLALEETPPRYSIIMKILGTLYGIWNLDFFRTFDLEICLGTGTLVTLSLDLVIALYPLLLMVLSYALISVYDRNFRVLVLIWTPFRGIFSLFHRNWEIRTSLIDSFATFLLLSNVKFLSVAYDLLFPVEVHQLSPAGNLTSSRRLYYDASIPHFGSSHLPFAVFAIAVLVLFAIFPAVILLFYPFQYFQKLLNMFPVRWHILHTFMDSFHGCYKNGTEPSTRDCRWFASIFFLVRYSFFLVSVFITGSTFFPMAAITLTLLSLSLVLIQPFKTELRHYSNITATFILFLALFYASVIGVDLSTTKHQDMVWFFYTISVFFACLPLLYISTLTLQWIVAHRKFGLVIFKRWQARKHGYTVL